jgi:phage repressor protein C with HTH and peptisase S24 domain
VAISQAEKSLRAAQTGAQQNAKAVEKENALRTERERRLQQMAEEEEEEDDDLPDSTDPESEIDRREEENLEYNQQIPFEYIVSWALKALIGLGPFPRRAVKWQGKVGEDWA